MLLQPSALAARAFASVQLGDPRRAERAVTLAAALFQHPAAPLPQQTAAPKERRAAYRLLNRREVTHAALQQPHWQQTRAAAAQHPVVLFVQDTTALDYTAHPTTTGLGPIGNGGGRGFLVQSVLAVVPQPRQLLGLAYQEPFLRRPVPKQTSSQRKKRDRESQAWPRAAAAGGGPSPGTRWVHVGDAYSDMVDFFEACRQSGTDFLVRACQDRRIFEPAGRAALLRSWARTLPAQAEQWLDLPARSARDGQPAQAARRARLQLAFSPATLRPPAHGGRGRADVPVWVVRVWEPEPPAGVEALEWVLVTTVPVTTVDEAWERVAWYRCRWLCEDYHQCLKTGCALERRQLQTAAGLQRLLGLLGVVAVWLLQLREWSRLEPQRPATEVVPPEVVQVVAALSGRGTPGWPLGAFWKAVAGLGGYLGRKGDGPPGWKTVWRGWLHVQTVLIGVHLAHQLGP